MSDSSYDAIVVGGGRHGLMTACYLQKAGMKTAIFELAYNTGGAVYSEPGPMPGLNYNPCANWTRFYGHPAYADFNLREKGLEYIYPEGSEAMAAREGARVMAVDIVDCTGTMEEIEASRGVAKALRADVSSLEETRKMAEETVKAFGKINVLINSAAIIPSRKGFLEIEPAEWDKVMAVNVKDPWLCTKAIFPYMKSQGKGKIINFASETFFTGSHGFAHYVTTKGGVVGLTRSLAVELGPYHITVNAIGPGFTDTEGAHRIIDDVSKYHVSRTPLGRLQQPYDLIGAAIFVASDGSDFITGQTLVVDGGRFMH